MGKLNARRVASIREAGMYGDGHGLWLQVTPPDGKSWILRTKVHGKTKYIGLGSAHLVPLLEAREEAIRLRKVARSGGDPLSERRRETVTFEQAARKVYEAQRKSWKNAKHETSWIASLEKHVHPTIGDRDIATLSSADVLEVLAPIWHRIPETASRVRQRMRVVFDWAKTAGHYHAENPVNSVGTAALGAQKAKSEHLSSMAWADVPTFMRELYERDAVSARLLAFQIFTATRPGEARGARWHEINFEERVWTIPGSRMKADEEHRVPLSKEAVTALEAVQGLGQDLVFPAAKRGKDGAEKECSDGAVRALMKRMGREDVTAHGFRSSFRSWAQEKRHEAHEVLEMCLAHRTGNAVSQAYARSDLLDQRRPVMEAWGRLHAADKGTKVVPLHGAGA